MSLLNVPSTPFPPVFSPSTPTPTPLTGIWLNQCATPLRGGPSSHLAVLIPNTGCEPKFCIGVSGDVTVTASEDLKVPRHSGASSSSQRTAGGSVETRFIRDWPQETVGGFRLCCKSDLHQRNFCGNGSWNNCFKSFRVCDKDEERSRPKKNLCIHWKDRQHLHRILESAVRGERLAQQRQVARDPGSYPIRGGWLAGAGGGCVLCSPHLLDSSQRPRINHSFLFLRKFIDFSSKIMCQASSSHVHPPSVHRSGSTGLIASARKAWQEEEETRKDNSTVLILQEQLCASELFNVNSGRNTIDLSQGQCTKSEQFLRVHLLSFDVQSIYIPSRIQDWYREDKIWSKDRRYSLQPWIPCIRLIKIHKSLIWPNHVLHRTRKWKRHQDTVYWVEIQRAQRKGFKFYQTRSNSIILYDRLPAYCISKAIVMKSQEIMYLQVYASPRPPPKIFNKDKWMKELDSEVAGSSKDSQQIQSKSKKPNYQARWDLWVGNHLVCLPRKSTKMSFFGFESTNVSTESPVKSCVPVPVERFDKNKNADDNVDADQISTGRPVKSGQSIGLFTQREEIEIDFRVSWLPHAVVKQAENFRVRELVKKIESHPHREALQADLQQNSVYKPFSNHSKAMIREKGNVELFELCETIPKVQCSECLLYWNQGVI